ncbi:MAG: hydroxymethylbilane synthase [Anaerolineales bacterium]
MSATKARTLTLASRPSTLARWQAQSVQGTLTARWPGLSFEIQVITTPGGRTLDQPLPEIGGKGVFTEELETALREKRVDFAVHSLKDLPIDDPHGLRLGAILQREDPRDVLVSRRGETFTQLLSGMVVGTSSPRRRAQVLAMRPDLKVESIRGNVETRVHKVQDGHYDAAVLAAAGLLRLGLESAIQDWFSIDQMLPAPGQGALAVQCRAQDAIVLEVLAAVDAVEIRRSVTAERSFLASLGGGCSLPVGAYATLEGEQIRLRGVIAWEDGSRVIRGEECGSDPLALGRRLAEDLLGRGGQEVLGLVG